MLYYSETENNKAFIYINIALIISMGYIPLCLILEEKNPKAVNLLSEALQVHQSFYVGVW